MKIGGNEHINNINQSSINEVNTKQEEIRVADYLVQGSSNEHSFTFAAGKSASVTLSKKVQKSVIPGFTKQNIAINTANGTTFNISLHVQASTSKEQVKELQEKLCQAISNMPPGVLVDMKEEVRHITICPNIMHNPKAKALAIGELNQIFLSAERLSSLNCKDLEETLIHEQGHLLDRREGTFAGKWSQYCKKNFNALKEVTTPDFGFEKDSYTMSSVSECFADYYLYKCGFPSDDHRGKIFFDTLEKYYNDVSVLSDEELQAKYGDKTDSIKDIAQKWKALQSEFDFLLEGTQSGKYKRAEETVIPLSIEQILEYNNAVN